MLSEASNGAALSDQLTPTFLRSLPSRPHQSDLDTRHPLFVGTNALLESQTLPDHPSLTRHRPLSSSILTNRSRLTAPVFGLQRKRLSTRQMRFGSKRNGKSLKDDPIRCWKYGRAKVSSSFEDRLEGYRRDVRSFEADSLDVPLCSEDL